MNHTDRLNVASLVQMFDLEIPLDYKMLVTDHELVNGNIVIKSVDVYDLKGKFVKKAELDKLYKNINKYCFVWK